MASSANNSILIIYLKQLLKTDEISDDIVSYIRSIQTEEDFEEFMGNLVDKKDQVHLEAYQLIKQIVLYSETDKSSTIVPTIPQSNRGHPVDPSRKKGKTKFHNINTYQVKKKEKEGRSVCDCLGQEHGLFNTCRGCGKIHCLEEGEGPCFFCGNPVSHKRNFPANYQTLKAAMKPRKNKVFDDDNDYFKFKPKNTPKEDRKSMVVALDFASRKVVEGVKGDLEIRQRLLMESIEHIEKAEKIYKQIRKETETSYRNKMNLTSSENLIKSLVEMRHNKLVGEEDLGPEDNSVVVVDYGTNIIDEELLFNSDHGVCLSLHQPYASLLVAGVKKHEGRTWPTNHRGKLWIAAAAKQPEEDEILSLEGFYREYYQDPSLKFPREYPTGCLLGLVFVKDCLEQTEYRKQYPNGESNSPYVMICLNSVILPIFYPIIGKHKIYPLDKELHKCAKIALRHAKIV